MEVEKESLMKLRKLEAQLMNVIEKVDKEINQVDVEWLNLRSIALEQMQSATQDQKLLKSTNDEHSYSQIQPMKSMSPVKTVKNEFRDTEFETLQLNLEVNPRVHQEIDEEFDSD